jgi:hypothetical protein
MERVVNLDATPRPVVTLQVAGQSFTIRRVVTGVHRLWSAYVRESVELLDQVDQYSKQNPDAEEVKRQLSELTAQVDEFYRTKVERMLQIIELLLTKNGYPFDRDWWIDNAGEEDYREFIIEVLNRATEGAKKNEGA